MVEILVTNDDGILSVGIQVLADALKQLGNVTIVAPSQEQSSTGHSLTLHKPIRLEKVKPGYYHINGTPPDCVLIATKKLFPLKKPDLVVSCLHRGPNLGNDIHYSGTVAAAREATFLKLPAMAVSLDYGHGPRAPNFEGAAQYALKIAQKILKRGLPKQVLLNVNVPDVPLKNIHGIRVCKTGFRYYEGRLIEQKDPRGKNYYWLSGKYLGYEKSILGSDCHAVDQGYVSVTPLHIDASHAPTMTRLQKWNFKKVHETVQKSI